MAAKSKSIRVTIKGKKRTFKSWKDVAAAHGINPMAHYMRVYEGWDPREAATTPQRAWTKRKVA